MIENKSAGGEELYIWKETAKNVKTVTAKNYDEKSKKNEKLGTRVLNFLKNLKSLMQKINRVKCNPEGKRYNVYHIYK